MDFIKFKAHCPVEINDEVYLEGETNPKTITDIVCMHFVKSGRVEFRFEFDNDGKYVGAEFWKGEGLN